MSSTNDDVVRDGRNFGMVLCGTISVTCRTVGLIRATGLKGCGTFTGLGKCNRFRWALVIGNTLMRDMPFSGGRVADSTPSRMATYSLNVGIVIPVGTPTTLKNKKGGVTISTGRGDGTDFQQESVRVGQFFILQHGPRRGRG